jgi:hypothetical protein
VVLTFGAVALIVAWVIRADRPPVTKNDRAAKPSNGLESPEPRHDPTRALRQAIEAGEQAAAKAKKKGG